MNSHQSICLYCEKTADQVPLIAIQYREQSLWICPQHLPILIHKPAQLAHIMPGVEKMDAPDEHHH